MFLRKSLRAIWQSPTIRGSESIRIIGGGLSMKRAARHAVVVLCAVVSAGIPAGSVAWEGARVRRIEPPVRAEAVRHVQVPMLSYDPVPVQIDRDGRVWLSEKSGTVRILVPYGGQVAAWNVPAGLESATLPDRNGTRLVLNRDGLLLRLDPAQPGTYETIAVGLPGGVGRGCRLGDQYFWTDALGGVVVTDRNGNVLQRVADVLFSRKRYRGGAVALCGDDIAVVGVAGGKIARFERDGLVGADTPGAIAGASFAAHAIHVGNETSRAVFCTVEHGCVLSGRSGNLATFIETGSFDGPARIDAERFVIALNNGRIALFDQQGALLRDAVIGSSTYWLLRRGDEQMAARTGDALWITSASGDVLRVSGLVDSAGGEVVVDRVLSVPSGFGNGGPVLADGTGLLRSNYGALYVLDLR